MKTNKVPRIDSQGRKFLFYYMNKPVYEGDETHQQLERIRKKGGIEKAIRADAKEVEKNFKDLGLI